MAKKMLVDLQRCVGCWTCAMACKVGNGLEDDDYRIIVRTNGSGAGIDRPQGTYPNLRMGWQPIYQKSCTFCQAVQRCLDLHYHLFEIPAREGTRANVTYAVRE